MDNIFEDIDREFEEKFGKPQQKAIQPKPNFFQRVSESVRKNVKEKYEEYKSLKKIEHKAFIQEKKKMAGQRGRERARRFSDFMDSSPGDKANFKGFNTKKLFR